MNRLTDNDKNWWLFTLARWGKRFEASINSGDDEHPQAHLMLVAFGWALRIRIWNWLCRPWRERWVECNWDAETVKRLGRSGYWATHPREFGITLSDMGNGYDFLAVRYGAATHDSTTDMHWCKHLPWKQWRHVRHSLYHADGTHFSTEDRKKDWRIWSDISEKCPTIHFGFEDYDGELIVAACKIEEREWLKGEGCFKWLSWFSKPKISRSLDLRFSAEVGPEKGSWKGGTIGHGIDMLAGESPEGAFKRYCLMEHSRKGKTYKLRFIGKCSAPVDLMAS